LQSEDTIRRANGDGNLAATLDEMRKMTPMRTRVGRPDTLCRVDPGARARGPRMQGGQEMLKLAIIIGSTRPGRALKPLRAR